MNKQKELSMRLDMLMPIKWLLDFSKRERRDVKDILTQVVQANQEWVEEVVKDFGFTEHKLTDVLHDFKGIYAEDEHFLPRISTEVSDVKVYGYTNIQTYRLCGWLDQITNYHNKGLFDYFFDLVRDGEFEESDYEVIDWNEVVKRYSNEQRSHYLGSITRS